MRHAQHRSCGAYCFFDAPAENEFMLRIMIYFRMNVCPQSPRAILCTARSTTSTQIDQSVCRTPIKVSCQVIRTEQRTNVERRDGMRGSRQDGYRVERRPNFPNRPIKMQEREYP